MKSDTKLVRAGRQGADAYGVVNVPVFNASTVLFHNVADMDARNQSGVHQPFTYGRRGTPTLWALEDAFAELHGAEGGLVCPSGVAALALGLLAFLDHGDHVLITDNAYGPTRVLAKRHLAKMGVQVDYFDPMIGAGIETLIRPNTKLIVLESPGSQTFEVHDTPAITGVARARGITTAMDNTWATPLRSKPLELGVDVVIESATKFICGTSDTNAGLIAASGAALAKVRQVHGDLGQTLGPNEAHTAQKGLRSLKVRMDRHEASAWAVAQWLASRSDVIRVLHPNMADHPGHAAFKRDFTGASSLFGFLVEPCPRPVLSAFFDGLELFGLGYSYGGFESLALPQDPRTSRTASPWTTPGALIRLHIGLEDVEDLKADLTAGFVRLAKARAL